MRFLAGLIAMGVVGCSKPAPVGISEVQAREKLTACSFDAGALAKDTLFTGAKVGSKMPIDHFVLVMQENRSFDHYFSRLSHGGVHVASANAENPTSDGGVAQRYHETRYCLTDVAHSWNASHRQFNDGKNDGFVLTNDPQGERALGYYDESDLPSYYGLGRTFAMSDMHFASIMGPTQPNRIF